MMTRPFAMIIPANRQALRAAQNRFTPCAGMGLLLKRTAATGRRAWSGGVHGFLRANPGFDQFQDRRHRVVQVRFMNKLFLTSCEVFRGKISRPATQPNLNERTQSAPSP
jgi:hypothetical protein